jgi:hypothetical protein
LFCVSAKKSLNGVSSVTIAQIWLPSIFRTDA